MNLVDHLIRQMAFSHATFGPGTRTAGVADHIRKELDEVLEAGGSADEWVDVVILALDGLTTQFTTDNLLAMQSLTGDALVEAYRRWVDGQWTVVVVGDASLYADQLKELGRGEVTVVPN